MEILQALNLEYLAQVCIRVVQGAGFHGRFFRTTQATTNAASTWYECETCLISNVAVAVQPGQLITAEIDFVTSGPIVLLRHAVSRLRSCSKNLAGWKICSCWKALGTTRWNWKILTNKMRV